VAVLLTAESDPAILFIKRKERVGDPWSGQMALPGGYLAPADPSLTDAARRETEEETGIVLADPARLVGVLDDVSPRSAYLPSLIVTPHVFLVPTRLGARPGPEVDAAVWLRVADVYAARHRSSFRLTLGGQARDFDAIVIGAYTIWGLTERILGQLAAAAA
jgi:8-oxo-dGTP pyrophosphatase MutT (NUDIX family)